MGLTEIKKGQTFRKAGKDNVAGLDIIVKGSVVISTGTNNVEVGVGGALGLAEKPGQIYLFDYTAAEDTNIYTYPYEDLEDIYRIVKNNPRICTVLAAQSIKNASDMLGIADREFQEAVQEYEGIKRDFEEYPVTAVRAGLEQEYFPEIEDIVPPDEAVTMQEWEADGIKALAANEERMRKYCYNIAPEVSMVFVMRAYQAMQAVADELRRIAQYRKDLASMTSRFTTAMRKARDRASAHATGSGMAVSIHDALETILEYAGADPEPTEHFRDAVHEFRETPDRYDSSDETRALRRKVSADFYTIYTAAFLRSMEDPGEIPPEVKMMFMFGFVDEVLAGEAATKTLYELMMTYKPDPEGIVLTVYEWLQKIYNKELEPSRNEFDEDYPTALRTLKISGDINEKQMEAMYKDPKERLLFEVKNLFTLGNRMTFGRISTFVPVFDEQNVVRSLETSYVTAAKIHDFYKWIRSVDFSVFCRSAIFSDVDIGVNQLVVDDDVTPYMILFPNMGSRASLWQEIEGKKRSTPGRLIVSIFHTETLEDVLTKLCGEFRWEMCKTEQGVHWNDVTDPSLTAMYCDYLQFYKKNHTLSSEMKEKLKTQLQKFNNNYKNVFISDYICYIKFEASGSPRLNKIARDILFEFCTFSKEYRDKLLDNPQYTELINKYNTRIGNTARPLQNLIRRIQKDGLTVPEEMKRQYEFYKK